MMATPQAAANLTTQTAQAAVQPEPIQKVRVFLFDNLSFDIIYSRLIYIFPRSELSLFLYQVFYYLQSAVFAEFFIFLIIEQKDLHLKFQSWQNKVHFSHLSVSFHSFFLWKHLLFLKPS